MKQVTNTKRNIQNKEEYAYPFMNNMAVLM